MSERIRALLEKYWEAESSLAEEKELKDLLQNADGFEPEKKFFGILASYRDEESTLKFPKKEGKVRKIYWLGWAASIAILVSSFVGWRAYEKHQQEQAYQEVVAALNLIQVNLSKGQEQMQVMNDIKYLSTPSQLFESENK